MRTLYAILGFLSLITALEKSGLSIYADSKKSGIDYSHQKRIFRGEVSPTMKTVTKSEKIL